MMAILLAAQEFQMEDAHQLSVRKSAVINQVARGGMSIAMKIRWRFIYQFILSVRIWINIILVEEQELSLLHA